ncbi:hypothetical protein [Bacillus sp. J33]|uniref:hypothetical protein n=1 Tax=Bacillus sp. J33 TaxID=935836 RepID=UPI00047A48F8|nr:hypothetical protein [Bacillus sp. J33]
MKKNVLIIFAIIITLFFGDRFIRPGIESSEDEKKKEETKINRDELEAEDYEKIFKKAMKEAEGFGIKDRDIESWVVRQIAYRTVDNKPALNKQALINEAMEKVQYADAYMEYAEAKYGVSVSEQEMEALAEEELSQVYAKAYGVTPKEALLKIERKSLKQAATLKKLFPILKEEYNTDDDHVVLSEYASEVENFMAGNGMGSNT